MTPTEPTQPPVSPTTAEGGSTPAAGTPAAASTPDARQATSASAPSKTPTTGREAKDVQGKPAWKPKKQLTHEQRESQRRRRGTLASGALAMPIITLGATLMAVPLGIWYVSTVFKTIIVVITNMVTGRDEAESVNGALNNVDPGAMSSISVALIIIGAVLVVAALVTSYFMLRAHDVARPMLVTVFSVPMATVVAAVITASIGALGGLLFRSTTETVGGILGNAALGIAGFALAAIAVSIVIGAAAWWWVAHVLRSLDGQAKR